MKTTSIRELEALEAIEFLLDAALQVLPSTTPGTLADPTPFLHQQFSLLTISLQIDALLEVCRSGAPTLPSTSGGGQGRVSEHRELPLELEWHPTTKATSRPVNGGFRHGVLTRRARPVLAGRQEPSCVLVALQGTLP